jgi:hypothetical protein
MDASNSTTKLCTKPWCKQSIPNNSIFKTCDHCRELDRINQQAYRTKKNEMKTAQTGIPHTTTGQKRRIDQNGQDLRLDRPSHRFKIHDNLKETRDEDVFKLDGIKDVTKWDTAEPDIIEPDKAVSRLNFNDRELLRIKLNTGNKHLFRCPGSF